MTDAPQRPPRPDEELARFHNGDTLDNIPVVLPAPDRRPPLARPIRLVLLAVAVCAVGALAGVGIVALTTDDDAPPAAHKGGTERATAHRSPLAPGSPSTAWSAPETKAARLEQVRVIRTPPTGGDTASDYCLVYTGSSSGPAREAILLMGAPAYQCTDLLPVDPSGMQGPLMAEVPDCEAPARPAVLTFAEPGGWEGEVLYTCLTEHNGA